MVPHISQRLVALGFEKVQAAHDHRWGENVEVEVEVEETGERQILQENVWEGELR